MEEAFPFTCVRCQSRVNGPHPTKGATRCEEDDCDFWVKGKPHLLGRMWKAIRGV